MKYLKVDQNTFVQFDEETKQSKTIIVSDLEMQIQEAQNRLDQIPDPLSDEELLNWARLNYPQTDYSVEKNNLENIILINNQILEEIKNGSNNL